jgi:hypothetical protein
MTIFNSYVSLPEGRIEVITIWKLVEVIVEPRLRRCTPYGIFQEHGRKTNARPRIVSACFCTKRNRINWVKFKEQGSMPHFLGPRWFSQPLLRLENNERVCLSVKRVGLSIPEWEQEWAGFFTSTVSCWWFLDTKGCGFSMFFCDRIDMDWNWRVMAVLVAGFANAEQARLPKRPQSFC